MLKQTICSLFVIGMMAATTACEKTIEYPDVIINFADSSFKTNVTVNQQQIDSSQNTVRAYADPEISLNGGNTEVRGGDLTNVNNGGNGSGGENGSEPIPVIPAGYHVWLIPVPEVQFHYSFIGGEDEFFERFYPSDHEVPVGFYDGGSDPTTLSFPFDDRSHLGYYNGKEGADIDKTRDLMILRIYDNFAELEPCRKNKKWLGYSEYGNFYLVGITGMDGNSPDEKTGRTLMGVSPNGRNIILMVASSATTLEAYDTFVRLFPNSPVMVVGGGNSSRCFLPEWQGTKKVPLTIKVTDSMKL